MPQARALVLAAALAAGASFTGAARQSADFETLSLTASGPQAAAAHTRVVAMVAEGRLRTVRLQEDTMVPGRAHERLEQQHLGVPVFGGGIVRQIDGGTVRSVFGTTYEGVAIATDPVLGAAEASEVAARAVDETARSFDTAVLGVLPLDGLYHLAWRVPVRSGYSIDDLYIDAVNGAVLKRRSRLQSQLGDIGTGHGVFGHPRKIAARRGASGFEAHDAVRPGVIETFTFFGVPSRFDSFARTGVLTSNDLAKDEDNVWEDGVVVDAHAFQGYAYDYFFKRFGRRGMDDVNGPVTAIVRPLARSLAPVLPDEVVDTFINNALYLQGTRLLLFGDGDGQVLDYLAGALDVVAHEWTHGVTNFSSDLVYEDEPGALNESFSDIMGAAVEFMFQPPGSGPQQADWLIGEDVFKLAPALRSMSNPAAAGDPDHYSLRRFIGTPFDNGGIHFNSSIPNHAFYLAVAGGRNRVSGLTVQGVGLDRLENMERIFYRAFVYFLTPNARFTHARAATLAAADELFGPSSPEVTELRQAWTAVGVQ